MGVRLEKKILQLNTQIQHVIILISCQPAAGSKTSNTPMRKPTWNSWNPTKLVLRFDVSILPQLRRALEERLALDDLELWEISGQKGQVFTLPEDPEE